MRKKAERQRSDRIAREFAAELRKRLGDCVQKIILYGSRARGDFWEGSDFDFLVILDPKGRDFRELDDEAIEAAVEILNHYDLLVSPQVLSPEMWELERWGPWGGNIQEEGKVL